MSVGWGGWRKVVVGGRWWCELGNLKTGLVVAPWVTISGKSSGDSREFLSEFVSDELMMNGGATMAIYSHCWGSKLKERIEFWRMFGLYWSFKLK